MFTKEMYFFPDNFQDFVYLVVVWLFCWFFAFLLFAYQNHLWGYFNKGMELTIE